MIAVPGFILGRHFYVKEVVLTLQVNTGAL